MKSNTTKIFLAAALMSSGTIVQAETLTLVRNNQPNATIVLQAKAPKNLQQAALDLQTYIEKICGVKLPLNTDGKDVPGITLNVGNTDATLPSDLPEHHLNPETYAIRQRGDDVYFTGNYSSPAAFAVYSYLQDQLGVRWFAPGDDWEYVPSAKDNKDFSIEIKEVVSVPGTSPRIWVGHEWVDDWRKWNLRNKAVVSEKVPRYNRSSNMMYQIFPQSKYAKEHPEYYPLIKDKRWIPPRDNYRPWWPCIGNKDVQRITAEYIHQWFKDNPDQDSYSLGMDDIVFLCSDTLCRAMDAQPDDYEKRNLSSRTYKFINIIAKQIKKTDPGKHIGVLIYQHVVKPPVDVPKLEDNVFGYIADGSAAQWYQPGKKEEWIHNTSEWAKRVKYLSRYDYYGLGTFAPRIFSQAMDESIKLDKSLGFEGMHIELYTFLPQTAPMTWALAQLQWNPTLNVDTLLNEFYTKMYGPAAPTMKKYFDLMEDSWNTNRPGHTHWVHRSIIRQAASISPEALQEGMRLLELASQQSQTTLEKKRIDITRGGLQYAGYIIQEAALVQELTQASLKTAADAQKMADKIQLLGTLIRERESDWHHAMQRQDLLGESLRGLKSKMVGGGETYLRLDTSPIENPVIPYILKLVDWCEKNEPSTAPAILKNLMDSFPEGNIRRTVNAWMWVQKNHPRSLLKNGDFEDLSNNMASNTAAKVPDDWSAQNAPVNWWAWSRDGMVKFRRNSGYDDSGNGIRVQSNTELGNDDGIVIQGVDLDPEKRYLGVVWVKSSEAALAQNATITFHFRTDEGWFKGDNAVVTTTAAASDKWQPLFVSSDVPKGATSMSFMLGVKGGDAVFDNAALYEIIR